MIDEIRQLTEQYHAWLREKTNLRSIDDWVEITAPFLDRHNDFIQIYARRTDDGYFLTDDGETIDDLELSGCTLDSPKRKALLGTTLNGFGVRLDSNNNALVVRTNAKDFARKQHNLLQAMLAVNDLFYLATPIVKTFFVEDVEAWLRISNVRFVPGIKLPGKSGYDHLYNFIIPESRNAPERVLLGVNRPDGNSAKRMVFAWEDTRQARPTESRAYAILNDSAKRIPAGVLDAFSNYDMKPVPWSQREDVREELAA
ncbi:MAG: DUF1829 domain-containing protein [Anaerolineaceae bacterium]|nr:DUF1829 domain-containing protein [Anaerolineaceae bacterium]MCY4022105.1 DUF1829 domain-containing protein [Anaerolineaceae bacterium]